LEVRAGDVAMGEELGDVGSYREVHVEFFLAQLQGEVTAFEEDQKTMFVPSVWKMGLLPQPVLDGVESLISGVFILVESFPDVDLLFRSGLYQKYVLHICSTWSTFK
jgi:hypothetical protein